MTPQYCARCGQPLQPNATVCAHCGQPVGVPVAPTSMPMPTAHAQSLVMNNSFTIAGVGGWLLVYAVVTLISVGWTAFNLLSVMGDFNAIDPSETQIRNDFLTDIIMIIGYCMLELVSIGLLFTRKKFVRWTIIGIIGLGVIASLIDVWLVNDALQIAGLQAPDDIYQGIVQSVIFAAVWIPYFARSQRSKETFSR